MRTTEEIQQALYARGLPLLSVSWLAKEVEHSTGPEKIEAAVLDRADFRDRSVVEHGSIRPESQATILSSPVSVALALERPVFLQIVVVIDISTACGQVTRPSGSERTLKLLLTDGEISLPAIEDAPVPGLETNLPPLTKVCLLKWLMLHGLLLLRPEYVLVVRPCTTSAQVQPSTSG
ncbi:hypothetical protein CCYA_CCYA04G1253 [Cyanidiococcus yangmingshanensis]|nr:hypothetical protein CCYA_CCYA04G1248 [Cyanidiococcus yangmingshanensis]KAK4530396.1 hypothetical protein CCYA_CCYA04G1253 [Cyanidiococcus yangmingshanensis]